MYSRASDSGLSEEGTLYVIPLYKGHWFGSQNIIFHIVSIHWKTPRRRQPLYKGQNSWIYLSFQSVPCSEALLYIVVFFSHNYYVNHWSKEKQKVESPLIKSHLIGYFAWVQTKGPIQASHSPYFKFSNSHTDHNMKTTSAYDNHNLHACKTLWMGVTTCIYIFVGSCLATKVFIGKLPATRGVRVIIG